ncbi:thioesterase II family protein [Microbacterium enclense]|uniref:thioesterase II family protein n=1 Tax=Microbacterium enclense TaxID=993073 RepID=UPI003F7E4E75
MNANDGQGGRGPKGWLRKLSAGDTRGVAVRLICFPYAGGGASVYRPWSPLLPGDVELWSVQPPGREERLFEPPDYRMDDLISAVERELAELPELPTAFFGHSLGAVTAWETALRLSKSGEDVLHLFVSGCRALPEVHRDRRDLHDLSEEGLIEEIRRMNGTPGEVLANVDLMRLLLPSFRADYRVLSDYRHQDSDPARFPVTVYGGRDDPAVELADLSAWSGVVHCPVETIVLPGDHFFLNGARSTIVNGVSERIFQTLRTVTQTRSAT